MACKNMFPWNAAVRLRQPFDGAEAVVQVDLAVNLVIIKSLPGMAQACASALDSMRLPEVAGSIAGDDTVFVATRSAEQAVAESNTGSDRPAGSKR